MNKTEPSSVLAAHAEAPPLPDLTPLPGKQTGAEVQKLVGLMQRLLAPNGCPWDREQTLETLIPYLVEETYEVIDALHGGSVADHKEELGDLLLQVIFQSELRQNEGHFGIDDVAHGIVTKLVRRHPHVFGDVKVEGSEAVLSNWAKIKAEEKAARGIKSALDGIPRSAPALVRAFRTGEKAAAVGFDWPDAAGSRAKVTEELAEFDAAWASGDRTEMEHELGDLLFAVANLARKLGLDAESALRIATDKFTKRFVHMEEATRAVGRKLSEHTLDEMNERWDAAKLATASSAKSAASIQKSTK
ncbi:MAG TPA: nucleoside triphosphate pyrophosphohydrolase [Polyangia bacterium]